MGTPQIQVLRLNALAWCIVVLCAVAIPLHAATITVTTNNDSGPGSLRQGIAIANDGDTIAFGVTGNILLTSGELLVVKSITIAGPGPANLAVDGNANSRVFHIASGQNVSITGLTITNGFVSGQRPDGYGGGIYNDHATLTLSNCTISNNSAFTFGGGVYNDHASLTVNTCIISGNFSDNTGGGIYHDGSNGSASAEITGSIFLNNTSFSGGAIFTDGNSGTATLGVTSTTLSENSATETGGGIASDHSHVTLDNCTISGNSSQFNGGAIYSSGDTSGTANVQIVNSTLGGNSASNFGGAVYNRGTLGTAIVQIGNSTFSDNLAQTSGDSIYNFVQMGFPGDVIANLSNTIFKASASGENFFNDGGTITSLGYNLSSDDGGGFLTGPGDQINTDPILGPLQDNGGPTFTHELLKGSPAIDAGDLSFTPPPFYDQRGGPDFFRVRNGRIDIGSFEVQVGSTPTPTPRPIPTPRPRPSPHPRPTPP